MEILRMPRAMENRGFTGWPKIVIVGEEDETPTEGLPYIMAKKQDFALIFRLMVPLLVKAQPMFNWEEVYHELTGFEYMPEPIYVPPAKIDDDNKGWEYFGGGPSTMTTTLADLARDTAIHIDLNVLMELKMIPAFFSDVAEAIKVNVTNSFAWQDGYNKKTKLCTGSLTEQPRKKSLVILDISGSIPGSVSSGMLTLIKTITEVTHADLIITGGSSYFFANEEVRSIDIHRERARISRGNESEMFNKILKTHDMDYEVVITFGDSDHPGGFGTDWTPTQQLNIKKWYSFFVCRYDQYGSGYQHGVGYGRWVERACPKVEIIHNYKWVKTLSDSGR